MSAKIASERVALLDPDVDAEMGHMAGTETAATVSPSAQSISATGKSDVVLRVAGAIHHVLAVFLRRGSCAEVAVGQLSSLTRIH